MTFVIIAIFLAIIWLIPQSRVKDPLSKGVYVCFLGYWSLALVVSSFNPSGLFPVSEGTYTIIFMYLLFFIIGFSILNPKVFHTSMAAGQYDINPICNSVVFWSLYVVVFFFGLSTLINQRVALAIYSTGNIKIDPMALLFDGSRLKYYFYDLFCTPFYYFSMALFAYLAFYMKGKILKKALLLLLIIVYSLIGGGRATIIFVLFYLVLFLLAGKRISSSNSEIKPIKISFKAATISVLVVIFLFMGMVYITYIGKNGLQQANASDMAETSKNFLNQIIVYSTGPFRALDYAFKHPEVYLSSGYHFMRSTFCGFDYFISLVLGVLGFHFVPVNYETLSIMQDMDISVGNDISFNYAYTSILYHYIDLGVVGVCFYGFLFGYVSRQLILKSYKKSSFYYLALLGFIFYILMYTIFSNFFNKDYSVLYIVFLLIMAKKEKRHYSYE